MPGHVHQTVVSDIVNIHDLAGRSEVLDAVMSFTAQDLLLVVPLVLLALWFHEAGLRAGLAAVLGVCAGLAVGAVISSVWVEARPFAAENFTPLVAHGRDASFPSDHLLALGGVTGGLWFGARGLAVTVAAIAALVAFARVFAGLHYVGDVVFGGAIGFVCGSLVWFALAPVVPLLSRLDGELQRRGLRHIVVRGRRHP